MAARSTWSTWAGRPALFRASPGNPPQLRLGGIFLLLFGFSPACRREMVSISMTFMRRNRFYWEYREASAIFFVGGV
jgi:hypothetical protein